MQTLKNTFHGTKTKTKLTDPELDALSDRIYTRRADKNDKATQRRIWNKLCGIKGCLCGDDFGRRNK